MIYADNQDNLTEDLEKAKKFKEKVGDLLRKDNLMVNDDETEDTILKKFNHTKDSKNEPQKCTIKLGFKLGDKEDIAYKKRLSTGSLKNWKVLSKDKEKYQQKGQSNYISPLYEVCYCTTRLLEDY